MIHPQIYNYSKKSYMTPVTEMLMGPMLRFIDVPSEFIKDIYFNDWYDSFGSYSFVPQSISFRPSYSIPMFMFCLAHELTHAKQHHEGRLISVFKNQRYHMVWNNKNINEFHDILYHERPWEKEANTTALEVCSNVIRNYPDVVEHLSSIKTEEHNHIRLNIPMMEEIYQCLNTTGLLPQQHLDRGVCQ